MLKSLIGAFRLDCWFMQQRRQRRHSGIEQRKRRFALPGIILAILIVSVLGPSLFNLLLAIAIFSVPVYGRLAHALALVLRNMDYVEAARAVGGRTPRILLHHMLPNALPPLVVQATLTASTVVLSAASFSFLGLGVQPPTPERRAMMSGARELFGLDAALVHSTAPGRDGPKSQAAAR